MRRLAALSSVALLLGASAASAAPGELDPTFDGDGQVAITVCGPGGTAGVTGAATGPDGGVFFAVRCFNETRGDVTSSRLVHRLPDGGPDPAFGVGGSILLGGTSVQELVPVADGSVIVVGNAGGSDGVVRRIAPSGAEVASHTVTPTSGRRQVYIGAAATASGGIVLTGQEFPSAGSTPTNLFVERLDGALDRDPSFGDGGARIYPLLAGSEVPRSVAVGPAGEVAIAGQSSTPSETNAFVLRLLPGGTPDPGFGGDGLVEVDRTGAESAGAIAVRPDGRIVVNLNGDAVGQFLRDGAPDPAFGSSGVLAIDAGLAAMFLDSAGRLLLPGPPSSGSAPNQPFVFHRLFPSGAGDPSWGGDGRVDVVTAGSAIFGGAHDLDAAERLVTATPGPQRTDVLVFRLQGDPAPPAVVGPPASTPPAVVAPPVVTPKDTRRPRFTTSLVRSKLGQIRRARRFGVRILPDEPGLWTIAITAETQVKIGKRFKRIPGTTTTVLKRTKPMRVGAGVRSTRTVKLSPTVLRRVAARTHLRIRHTLTDAAGNTTRKTVVHRLRTVTKRR